jgi:hypothetical protein
MNKSKLLASTIIVAAASAVAVAPASAAKLKLGGYYEAWVGMGSDGNATTTPVNNFDVKHDSEINFDFKQKLKNGLTVGGRMEMKAGTGNVSGTGEDRFDESSISVSGSFGKFIIGNNDAAAASVGGLKGVGPVGAIKSDAGDWIASTSKFIHGVDNDNDVGQGDSQKIAYFTPKIGGMQFGLSYMPDASDGSNSDYDDSETSGLRDGLSAMAKYSGKAGSTKYSVAVGWSTVDSSGTDNSGYNVNMTVTQGATTLTAFTKSEESGATDLDASGVALMHKMNKTDTVSIQVGSADSDAAGTGSDKGTTVITAGYAKNMGGGVSLEASAFNLDTDNDSGTNISDMGVVGGFKIKF